MVGLSIAMLNYQTVTIYRPPIENCLVVAITVKKIRKSLGMMKFPIHGKYNSCLKPSTGYIAFFVPGTLLAESPFPDRRCRDLEFRPRCSGFPLSFLFRAIRLAVGLTDCSLSKPYTCYIGMWFSIPPKW